MAGNVYIGADKFLKRDLPSGYTQVEYIQSSGTQYIDTGFKANHNTKVVMHAALTSTPDSASIQAFYFGARTSATEKAFGIAYTTYGNYRYFYNTQYESSTLKPTVQPTEVQVVIADKNTATIGGISYSWTYGSFQCAYNMYLLAMNAAGTADWKASAKLYSCKIWDNGDIVRDFIPCKNPSGVVGLYDCVNGVFYKDAAGGTFTTEMERVSVSQYVTKIYIGDKSNIARKVKKAYFGDENGIAQEWLSSNVGSLPVGSSVYMNVNGVRKEFLVIHQGLPDATIYDSSCKGTWLLMKDIYELRARDSTNTDYENSDIHSYLNDTFVNLFDSNINSIIKQVRIPYTKFIGKILATGSSGLLTKVFLLSSFEAGGSLVNRNREGSVVDYFNGSDESKRKAYLNGSVEDWWLRCSDNRDYTKYYTYATLVSYSGGFSSTLVDRSCGVRPALILPYNTAVDENFNVIG